MNQALHRKLMGKLAWRNVLRNWRHSAATLLAISGGFVAVSVFDGFIRGVEEQMEDGYVTRGMLGQVIVLKQGATQHHDEDPWAYSLDRQDQDFLENYLAHDPDYQLRVRQLEVSGMVTNGRNSTVFIGAGYDPVEGARARGQRWEWNTLAGKPFHLVGSNSLIVAQGLGTLLGCESKFHGDYLKRGGGYIAADRPFECYRDRLQLSVTTESAQVNALEADVSGIMDAGIREIDLRWISMPIELAQKLMDTDKVTVFGIRLKEPSHANAFIQRLSQASQERGLKLDVLPWDRQKSAASMRSAIQIVHVFRNLFTTVVVLIAVLAIANTMMKSVSERVREIGTLRSLGFRGEDISFLFACEGFFICAIACVAGWVISSSIAAGVTALGLTYRAGVLSTPIPLEILQAPYAWLVTTFVLFILATGTAWIASRRAARLEIAESLRHV